MKALSALLAVVVAILLLSACAPAPAAPTAVPAGSPAGTPGAIGIANPASTFCVEKGNKLQIRNNADGSQYGVCIFPDATECEEWAYFRGQCGPGTPGPAPAPKS